MMSDSEFPEHDKLDQEMRLRDFTQKVGQVLEFGKDGKRYFIGRQTRKGWERVSLEGFMAAVFDIDLNKLEEEKTKALHMLRGGQ